MKYEINLRLSWNMIGDDETNFPHKLLLINREAANLWKAFADKSSTDIKLSKTQTSKRIQPEGLFSRLVGPLLKTGLPYAGIHKKILGSGVSETIQKELAKQFKKKLKNKGEDLLVCH